MRFKKIDNLIALRVRGKVSGVDNNPFGCRPWLNLDFSSTRIMINKPQSEPLGLTSSLLLKLKKCNDR
jgi:hypothetical protein